MEIQLKADHADELFDKMSNLIEEAILRFTEDGLEVTTTDPAQVSMIHLEVPESSFEEYEIDFEQEEYENLMEEGEEGLLIGLNLDNLSTVISLFDDDISFEVDGNDFVLTEGDDTFQLPILNLSTDDIPSMDALDSFNLQADIDTDQFKTLVKKLEIATDSTYLTLNNEGVLTVEGDGDQISVDTSFDLENVEELGEEELEDGETQSMFALNYLKKAEKMFRGLNTCDDLKLKMGEDFPLEMSHEDGRENLKFILAPRIEEA